MKLEFFIAGVQFRPRNEINEALKMMDKGDTLCLVPEPDNKYDPNAVKIVNADYESEIFLGYVPKKFSSEVSAAIEAGCEPCCTVVSVNPSAKTYEMFKVKISDEEEMLEAVERNLEDEGIYDSAIGEEEN